MNDAHILCVHCRATFTEEQTKGQSGCPTCGNKGLPADTRHKETLTLTHHEWRLLFMWADNWAMQCARQDTRPGYNSAETIKAIAREAKRQAPTMPGLSLMEEAQGVANAFGRVTVHQGDDTTVVEPEKKH